MLVDGPCVGEEGVGADAVRVRVCCVWGAVVVQAWGQGGHLRLRKKGRLCSRGVLPLHVLLMC
jgi:hypothetical protein